MQSTSKEMEKNTPLPSTHDVPYKEWTSWGFLSKATRGKKLQITLQDVETLMSFRSRGSKVVLDANKDDAEKMK